MKKIYLFLLFLAVALFASPVRAAAESIQKFEANYDLDQNGTIQVTENITYDFGGFERHGIFRYIPYKYRLDNGGTTYLNLSGFSVTDPQGNSYRFERSKENNNIVLKIGDPNTTVTGVHVYRIAYTVKGGLKYLDTGDEFYWNVSGNAWNVDIERITAKINLPGGVDPQKIRATCYRGAYNSKQNCQQYDVSGNKVSFRDGSLGPTEGLTVVVGVPKGTFAPSNAGYLGTGIPNSIVTVLIIIGIAIPISTLIFMLLHWWRHGRDPKGRGTIIAEYSAPDGLTAIEIGTLLDGRVDNKDLSAEIIYLATRGYLKIRRDVKKGLFGKDDYTFSKLRCGGNLKPFDEELLEGIFGSANEVKASDLKNKFYNHINSIKGDVHGALVAAGYFKESVATTIGKYLGIAFVFGFVGYWIAYGLGSLTNGLGLYIFAPSLIGSALIIAGFGLAMPARTLKGVGVKERILGLKEYMTVAESDRIKFHNAPKKDPQKFEELLPFAMVLGVEREWAKQFEGIYNGKPAWYDDPTGRVFVPLVFVNNMHSFTAITTQNMTSMPSSSGSGFGGGGFSGGGFGGGGGGSW